MEEKDTVGPHEITTGGVRFAWFPVRLISGNWRWLKEVYEKRTFVQEYDFMTPSVRRRTYYFTPEEAVILKLKGQINDSR